MSAPNVEKEPGPAGDAPVPPSPTAAEPEQKKREYKDFAHDEEAPTRAYISMPVIHPLLTRDTLSRRECRYGYSKLWLVALAPVLRY